MAIIKKTDCWNLMSRFNPFGVRDPETQAIKTFKDYGDLYLYTLQFLKRNFPKGIIDIPLAISKLTGCSIVVAEKVVNRMNLHSGVEDIVLINWKDQGDEEKGALIMICFHQISGTTFSHDFFNWAWNIVIPH